MKQIGQGIIDVDLSRRGEGWWVIAAAKAVHDAKRHGLRAYADPQSPAVHQAYPAPCFQLKTSGIRMLTKTFVYASVALSIGSVGSPASAEQMLTGYAQSTQLLTQLLGLLVVAAVLESALTTIFQWRLYREFFNGRAVKTLVMIGVSLAVVRGFNYDVFAKVMGDAGGLGATSRTSQVLSALVLAGGSAAIYQLLVSLGFRNPVEPPKSQPKPPENLAWVSIKAIRKHAIGDIRIHVDEIAAPTSEMAATSALSGTLGTRTFQDRMRGVFLADSMRFPAYGGHTVKANTVYRITASAQKAGDGSGGPPVEFQKEIFTGRFESRAIIDFVCDM